MNKLSMFLRKGGNFRKLRGKASEIRHFGPALLALAEAHEQAPTAPSADHADASS